MTRITITAPLKVYEGRLRSARDVRVLKWAAAGKPVDPNALAHARESVARLEAVVEALRRDPAARFVDVNPPTRATFGYDASRIVRPDVADPPATPTFTLAVAPTSVAPAASPPALGRPPVRRPPLWRRLVNGGLRLWYRRQ